MRVQISSGQGPDECELAVGLLYETLKRELGDVCMVSCVNGKKKGAYASLTFETEKDMGELEGSVLWICKSPFRPGHKRKNWYVNKVETGVRVVHIPTGIAVVSTEARSQHMNRQIALNRLCDILAERNEACAKKEKELAWMEHNRLARGNPARIYEGLDFVRRE